MHSHLAQDEQFVERFIREAKAAAALSHPNIVAVQDQGWNQNGTPAIFLVMEMIEGHTLREYLNEQSKLSVADGIKFLLPVLSELAAAHKIGIVHRDIKPENILISKEGRIKIADFGLARGELIGSTMTAESSVILGSVSYLSPEQVQRGIADSRSDVYAAGIVAYEMFTGEKPFNGDSPIQIAYMHVNEEIPRLRSKRKEIPQALDDLIASATAKNPDDRPRTAAEFLDQLQKIQIEMDPKKNQLDLGLDLPVEPIREKARKKVKEEPVKEETAPVKESTREIKRQEEKKQRASKRVRRNRKVALILAIALGVGGWWTLVGPGSRVVVPSTVGGTYDEAMNSFTPLGLTAVVVENRYDEEIPKGKIIQSIPEGGGKVDAGGSVKLIVSKGPERYTIPSVKGLTPEAAQAAITKSPLTFGTITEVFNSDIPKGYVISSTPVSGTSVKRDATVDLIVSKGIEQVALASYLGKSGEQALNELTQAGFNVEAGYAFSETVPELAVISQNPAGGASANTGGKVSILISKGPRYTYIPKTIITMEANAAKATLESLGLKVKVVTIGSAKKKVGKKVSPAVNTKVLRGSLVTITVG
jgi:serine/threonine-protein kinase